MQKTQLASFQQLLAEKRHDDIVQLVEQYLENDEQVEFDSEQEQVQVLSLLCNMIKTCYEPQGYK